MTEQLSYLSASYASGIASISLKSSWQLPAIAPGGSFICHNLSDILFKFLTTDKTIKIVRCKQKLNTWPGHVEYKRKGALYYVGLIDLGSTKCQAKCQLLK